MKIWVEQSVCNLSEISDEMSN